MKTLPKAKSTGAAALDSHTRNRSDAIEYWFTVELTPEVYAGCLHRSRAIEWRRIRAALAPGARTLVCRASRTSLTVTHDEVDRIEVHFVAAVTPSELRGLPRGIARRRYTGVFPGVVYRRLPGGKYQPAR